MEVNGSPPPIFQTDEHHSYFLVTLPIHPEATRKNNQQKPVLLKDETHQLIDEIHQLGPKTHQLPDTTHQNKEFLEKESLP